MSDRCADANDRPMGCVGGSALPVPSTFPSNAATTIMRRAEDGAPVAPATNFGNLNEVLRDQELSREQKRELLYRWALDAYRNEGGPTKREPLGERSRLNEIVDTLIDLDGIGNLARFSKSLEYPPPANRKPGAEAHEANGPVERTTTRCGECQQDYEFRSDRRQGWPVGSECPLGKEHANGVEESGGLS